MAYRIIKAASLLFGTFCLTFGLMPLAFGIWHAGCAVLILVGLVLGTIEVLKRLPSKKWKFLLQFLTFGFKLGCIVGLILSVWMIVIGWFRTPLANSSFPVLVLGCQIVDDRPSLMLRHRLDVALIYLKNSPETPVVVSGGHAPQERFSEAQVMATYLESHGIAPHRIFLEDASHNTQENILFSTQLAQKEGFPPGFAVATDGFHQLRASLYLQKCGFSSYSLPSQTPWGLIPSYWAREWVAILKMLFFP